MRLLPLLFCLAWINVCAGAPAGEAGPSPNGLVVMFTDYGNDSIYVGMLKGAMYRVAPEVRIDTLTNSSPAYDVAAGALLLAEGVGVYPPGTTFVCVVDPGVGTTRRHIVAETESGHRLVAPDNGLLSGVAGRHGIREVREATNTAYWLPGVESSTFHGRDIFGPVAARIAMGAPMEDVGPVIGDMVTVALPAAQVEAGALVGSVSRIDPYGNVVTTIPAGLLHEQLRVAEGATVRVSIGSETFTCPYVHTYASVPPGSRLVVVQSDGFVECAINQGSLAETLHAGVHDRVVLETMGDTAAP
jgi:S-adenosylmethionine hydrolase